MNYVNLPDELPEDPTALSKAEQESFSRSTGSAAGESAYFLMEEPYSHRDEHPTGEHPLLEESVDPAHKIFVSSSSERISAPRHENEPEDNLPDLLDRNK